MDTWKIKDMIKSGRIGFTKGSRVVIFRRKKSGYPKGILDNVIYTVRHRDGEMLYLAVNSADGIGWMQPVKVHRSYMVPVEIWRDMRLSLILED